MIACFISDIKIQIPVATCRQIFVKLNSYALSEELPQELDCICCYFNTYYSNPYNYPNDYYL